MKKMIIKITVSVLPLMVTITIKKNNCNNKKYSQISLSYVISITAPSVGERNYTE